MTQGSYVVEGRTFRTEADYKRALADKKKIDYIRSKINFSDRKQLEQLLEEIRSEKYNFYTLLGEDFADEVEQAIKKSGTSKMKGRVKAAKKSVKGKQLTSNKSGKKIEVSDAFVEKEIKRQERNRKLLVALCSLGAVACFGYLWIYNYYEQRTTDTYKKLSELKEESPMFDDTQPVIHYTEDEKITEREVLDEYKNLLKKNKRLIGWLKIADTNIDYPVMQTEDNEYYLEHNLNQEYDKNGSIFMDKDCDTLNESTNYILYGHNMRSGQMFGNLDKYEDESYYEEHRYIEFDTIYEKGKYEVMYVFRSRVYGETEIVFKYYQFIDAYSEQEFDSYMKEMEAISFYDTGVTAKYGDQLLTLSTCDYEEDNGRFVVVAKKVE